MSRRSNRNRHRTVTKRQQTMPGTVAVDAGALIAALTAPKQGLAPAEPLPRPDGWATLPFAPGVPLVPQPINPPDPGTGRAAPRRFDYPVSWNLPAAGDRLVPWKVLRDAAEQIDLFRRCIEFRKAEVRGYGWDVVVSDRALEQARSEAPDRTDAELGKDLRAKYAADIARLRAWWEMPDRTNGLDFEAWVAQIMEEHLVLDAIAMWPRRTLGGDLYALEVLDGSTIKPLLDERGNTPMPPFPAYQQVLTGFPRGEFVADAVPAPDGNGVLVSNGYERDQLIYERWSVRTFTPYGHSVVEQALIDADLWMKRQAWIRAEYTDGVMPAGWLTTDTGFTPEQLRAYNAVFNDYLSGNTRERQRVQVLPKGFAPVEGKQSEERYRPQFDEFLLKLVTTHFGVMPSRLGFTPNSGLGGKGHQEGEEDTQERQATRPVTEWLAAMFTRISRTMLGMPEELAFQFINLDAEDEAAADAADDARLKSGRMTLNETRDRTGQPRYDFPEADKPMVITATGIIFIEGEAEKQAQAQEQAAALAAIAPQGGASAGGFGAGGSGGAKEPTGATGKPGGAEKPGTASKPAADEGQAKAKADEAVALRRFAGKGNRGRAFVAKHLTPADVAALGLDGIAVVHEKGDGGASREGLAGLGDERRTDPALRPRHRAGFEWPRP